MQRSLIALCALTLSVAASFARPASAFGQAQDGAIYSVDSDVTPPILVPSPPIEISSDKCKKKNQSMEEVQFSFFVTSDGKPRRISFINALGNEIDKQMLALIRGDTFTPATRHGEQVAVWQSIRVSFQACKENGKTKDAFPTYRLISQPIQKLAPLRDPPQMSAIGNHSLVRDNSQPYHVGGGVSAPVPLVSPEARYTIEARKKRINGVCLVSVIVDAEGMPQSMRVVRPIGYGLDKNALDAIAHYRFKPALKGGFEPVPVLITVEVNYRIY